MADKIHFNEYGNLVAPEEFYEANREYWRKVEPMIKHLSILELRALEHYLSLSMNLTGLILRSQTTLRKEIIDAEMKAVNNA